MNHSSDPIKSINFSDVTGPEFIWDAVYKEYGVALRDGVKSFFSDDDIWEIEMMVFIVCLKGSMSFYNSNRQITLIPGNVLIQLPGSIVSKCRQSDDFQCRVLCMSPEVFRHHAAETGFFDMLMSIKDNPVFEMGFDSDSARLMDAYATILTIKSRHMNQNHVKKIIKRLIECLLYEMLSGIPVPDSLRLRQSHGSKYALFNRFIDLVSQDNGISRSVNKYALRLNVSPKYLTTICKSVSGKSAYQWINEALKIEISRLLQYTELSVKEISELLNFPDPTTLSKYMRHHFNSTALQYRKKLRS